jgi:hypothetical protein
MEMLDPETALWAMIGGCAAAVAFIVHVAMRPE